MMNMREIISLYINTLLDYCNTYDSEAISQVLLASQAQKIKMTGDDESDAGMYTELVDVDESKENDKQMDRPSAAAYADINGNHEKNFERQNDNKKAKITGEVILSEPGGGKTTYLKRRTIKDCEAILNPDEDYEPLFPILVMTRELDKTDIDEEDNDLSAVIIKSFDFVFKKSCDYNSEYARYLYGYIVEDYVPVDLIIDGFEEITKDENESSDGQLRDDGLVFLELLKQTIDSDEICVQNLTISSRYKEYGYQRLKLFVEEYGLKERIIPELKENEEKIFEFVRNWMKVFKNINPSFDPEKESTKFETLYKENQSIKNIISTPIELTSLIMIYITSYTLPTDVSILYRNIIEVWLTFNVKTSDFAEFSLEDILMELSRIAMYMACTDDEKISISEKNLNMVIDDARDNLGRYYRNQVYKSEPTSAKIGYIVRRNIMEKNGTAYQFKHRQYQAYLCAYGIIRNFVAKRDDIAFKENRQLDRMVYFGSHLDACDDFWDQILIFSAFMDIDLHDSIVEDLIDRTVADENNNYYLGILIQLMNSEGFWLEDYELEAIYSEMMKSESRWEFVSDTDNSSEVIRAFVEGRKENNTKFLEKAIERHSELASEDSKLARSLKDNFGDIVFSLLWKCDYDESLLDKALETFMYNYLTTGVMRVIDMTPKTNENLLRKKISSIVADESLLKQHDNLKMLIAAITVYESDKHPIEVALEYFKKGGDYQSVSLNIINIMTWLYGIDWECGFENVDYDVSDNNDVYESYVECKRYIMNGLMNEDGRNRVPFQPIFLNLPCVECDMRYYRRDISEVEELYTDEVFDYYISRCKNMDSVIVGENLFHIDYATLAAFPLIDDSRADKIRSIFTPDKIAQMKVLLRNNPRPLQSFYILKLLADSGIMTATDEILNCFAWLNSKFDRFYEDGSYKRYCSQFLRRYETKQIDDILMSFNDAGLYDESISGIPMLSNKESNTDVVKEKVQGLADLILETPEEQYAQVIQEWISTEADAEMIIKYVIDGSDESYGWLNEVLYEVLYDISMLAYSDGDYDTAEMLYKYMDNYNNLVYMVRRGEVNNPLAYSSQDIIAMLIDDIRKRDTFIIVNLALYLVSECLETKEWEMADRVMSLMPFYEDRRFTEAYEWWSSIAEAGDIEGYLVLLWMYRLYRIDQSPVGDMDDVMEVVKKQIPDLPGFFLESTW